MAKVPRIEIISVESFLLVVNRYAIIAIKNKLKDSKINLGRKKITLFLMRIHDLIFYVNA